MVRSIKLLCRRYVPGEAWTNRVLAYARGLAELDCEVELYYLISDKKRTLYNITISGVRVINLWERDGYLECKIRALSFLHNLIRFRSLLKAGDKVFVYGAERLLLKASFKKGVNVYAEITEHPYVFNRKGLRGEKYIDRRSKKFNRLNGLFVISRALRDYYCSVGVEARKIRISNMIVDPSRFEICKDPSIEPYIAYCGIVSNKKDGVDTLLKAFSIFHSNYPDYKLYIIGRFGVKEERRVIEELVDNLHISEFVVFTGHVSPEIMPKLLVNARILALARPKNLQSQNGFPTKMGEYLSTGNPIVVTDVGDISLFIEDGINGYLVTPDNSEEFAIKLKYVVDNYDEAMNVGQEGRKLVDNVFSYKSQSKVLYDFMGEQ